MITKLEKRLSNKNKNNEKLPRPARLVIKIKSNLFSNAAKMKVKRWQGLPYLWMAPEVEGCAISASLFSSALNRTPSRGFTWRTSPFFKPRLKKNHYVLINFIMINFILQKPFHKFHHTTMTCHPTIRIVMKVMWKNTFNLPSGDSAGWSGQVERVPWSTHLVFFHLEINVQFEKFADFSLKNNQFSILLHNGENNTNTSVFLRIFSAIPPTDSPKFWVRRKFWLS